MDKRVMLAVLNDCQISAAVPTYGGIMKIILTLVATICWREVAIGYGYLGEPGLQATRSTHNTCLIAMAIRIARTISP